MKRFDFTRPLENGTEVIWVSEGEMEQFVGACVEASYLSPAQISLIEQGMADNSVSLDTQELIQLRHHA